MEEHRPACVATSGGAFQWQLGSQYILHAPCVIAQEKRGEVSHASSVYTSCQGTLFGSHGNQKIQKDFALEEYYLIDPHYWDLRFVEDE